MRSRTLLVLVATGLCIAACLAPAAAATAGIGSAPAPAAPQGQALTPADVEAFFDGFFPDALARADIAGAVVVVVKDGHVVLEKGYGFADAESRKPVDPARTLFRPGSISKLFTWTAVMQLVESGKLDLDRDVNAYLDFRIPGAWQKPVTLRELMTHTAGFEEQVKGLMASDPKRLRTLRSALADSIPERMYPPGEVSAYSNFGASLAGYIVQRVSGEPFEAYVERHILRPLGMNHSTFVQPLPASLSGDMSKGYRMPEQGPQPFEYVSLRPAGALSATGDDLARFMMAHLANGSLDGAQILKPETAMLMHRGAFWPVKSLPPMALGFYHEDRNGHDIIGHAGDTQYFHSDLHLILDQNTGLFVSLNSAGHETSFITSLRTMLLDKFMERYFPGPEQAPPKAIATAKADAATIAGSYVLSRRSDSNFMRSAALIQQLVVVPEADGSLSIPFVAAQGGPKKWIEVAPFLWRAAHGRGLLAARIENGGVRWLSTDLFPPILVLQPAPLWQRASWNIPLFIAMTAMFALTVLFWPVKAVLRWRYDRPFALSGRAARLYRATRVVALIDLAAICGWSVFLLMGQMSLAVFDAPYDPVVRVLQALCVLGVIGCVVPALEFFSALGDSTRPWWTKASDALIALAAFSFVWFVFSLKLVTLSLNY